MRKYENSNITSENRLPQRSWYIPTESVFMPLNGKWKFAFFENGDRVQNIDKWDSIDVPSCWQLKGYENPNYSNINYPFPCDAPYVPDINPVGVYERTFEITNPNLNSYVIFEGVSSCAEVYINGQYVGFTQGSRLMAEFDITKYVDTGLNTVRVYVRKWCCGSYLEDQDAFRYNGIFRDVYILCRPTGHIFDLDIKTDGNTIICYADRDFSAELFDDDKLLETGSSANKTVTFSVENPKLWNAEQPYLYTVKIHAAGETITRKIGFRTIAVSKDFELLINDTPVKLRGVNHHDSDPINGWAMSEKDILRDLRLMKELNINTIRTSHYPPCPKFLDYCDEMGFYVILETDIETHGFLRRFANISYCFDVESKDWPCSNPEWNKEFVERMERAYERDKIHSSIIIWSTGNESGFGQNQHDMIDWLKARDTVRLAHCEDASRKGTPDNTDIYSRMYPSVTEIEEWAKDNSLKQPVFMCEYAHAMGNGPGGIWDYWKSIYNNKKLIGGCIWEWADHIVMVDGIQKYGGDFEGELTTSEGNFCCDGMVFANRELKAGSFEIKNTYAPFRISFRNRKLYVKNVFDFNDFSQYIFKYQVLIDGKTIEQRTVHSDVKPGESFEINFKNGLPSSCTLGSYVNVRMYSKTGFEIGYLEEKLPVPIIEPPISSKPLIINDSGFDCIVTGKDFEYIISKQTGSFVSIKKCGTELIESPVKLSFYRPITDNDKNIKELWNRANVWQGENFDCVFTKIYSCEVYKNRIKFKASSAGVSRKPFFNFFVSYDFFDDGKVKISLDGQIRENVIWLPRLGFEFTLSYSADKFTYFGNGPLESYRDMIHHGITTFHESNADGEYVNYVRPQEHGNHTDCHSLEIKNSLRFWAKDMEICVLHHSIDMIDAANHTDELKKSASTHVRIDYKDSGIGSGSCGPLTFEPYRLKEKDIKFDLLLSL